MTEFEQAVKNNCLTTKGDLIYVQTISQYECQTFPIDMSKAILITFEQYKGLQGGGQIKIDENGNQYQLPKYQFNKFLNGLEPYVEGDK